MREGPRLPNVRSNLGELATKMQVAFNTVCEAVASSGAPAPQNSVEQEMQDRGWALASFDEIDAELERLMNAAKFYAARLSMLGYNPDSPEPAVGEGI